MKMTFAKFEKEVVEKVKDYLPENVTVSGNTQKVRKNNGVELTGLCFSRKDSNVSPIIYLDNLILSILVYTFFSRMFDLMLPPVAKHSIAVA